MNKFDVIVIGGGPAGYIAAIKAAQLGKNVACIEKRQRLGGTCLNVGCIPSKALLQSSHKFHDAKHMESYGVEISSASLSLTKMMQRKEGIINDLAKGIDGLFRKNKVTRFIGSASLLGASKVCVTADGKTQELSAPNIIIATGSEVTQLPGVEVDEKTIVSSTGALELNAVPNHMVVIGGGYIGLEMSSIWSRLGANVSVIEYSDRVLPAMDEDVSKEAYKIFSAQGISFKLNTKVIKASASAKGAILTIQSKDSESLEDIECDIILACVGRRSHTSSLNLDIAGVQLDGRGRIKVDANYKTNVEGLYAIGDVIAGPMLAHKAEEEGVAVAEIIAGQHGHVNYKAIPGVVYTNPEIAAVGQSETELKAAGIAYNIGKFPFIANSRARTNGETSGFVKILAEKHSDKILGAQIIGSNAGDMIGELVLAMEFGASSEDIARTSHSHPGMSEAVKEAAMAAYNKPLHI